MTSTTSTASFPTISTPMRLPKLLIVHNDKSEADRASAYLNSRLPTGLQALGICKHYHGDMSQEYLDQTFDSFNDPDGNTIILNATSGAGTVCVYYLKLS
jgi:superfamily II DNA/RNA helicase